MFLDMDDGGAWSSRTVRLGLDTAESLWAFSTLPGDVALRVRLQVALGGPEARRRLAATFPKGTAGREIARLEGETGCNAREAAEDIARHLLLDAAAGPTGSGPASP